MRASAEPEPTRNGPPAAGLTILGLMAKYWTAGEVKTRLAASVGNQVSANLHRGFVIHLCKRLANTGDHREVVVTPPAKIRSMAHCLNPAWSFRAQSAGDLGARMRNWFAGAFQIPGCDRAVLIGADCPNLKPDEVQRAFDLLDEHEAVLGPARDGGYYLIGLRALTGNPPDHVFAEIPWSSKNVLEITRQRMEASGRSHELLPENSDIDNLADLNRLRDLLDATGPVDPFDAELAREIGQLLGDSESSQ